MDLDDLTTFLEIAKQGSFSRAGRRLFCSQPSVSAQIRRLEEEYGQKLFDRVGKSMKVTAAGGQLCLPYHRDSTLPRAAAAFLSMVRHGFGGDSDHSLAHIPHSAKKHKATK